jgi:hypothetical protein
LRLQVVSNFCPQLLEPGQSLSDMPDKPILADRPPNDALAVFGADQDGT